MTVQQPIGQSQPNLVATAPYQMATYQPQPGTPGQNPFTTTGTVPSTNLFYRYQQFPQTPSRMNPSDHIHMAAQYSTLQHHPDSEMGRAAYSQQHGGMHYQRTKPAGYSIFCSTICGSGTNELLRPRRNVQCLPSHVHRAAIQVPRKWDGTTAMRGSPVVPSEQTLDIVVLVSFSPISAYIEDYHYAPSPEISSGFISQMSPTASTLLDSELVSEVPSPDLSAKDDNTEHIATAIDTFEPLIKSSSIPSSPALLEPALSDTFILLENPSTFDTSVSSDVNAGLLDVVSMLPDPSSLSSTTDSVVHVMPSDIIEPINLYSVESRMAQAEGQPFMTQVNMYGEDGSSSGFHAHVDDGAIINVIDTEAYIIPNMFGTPAARSKHPVSQRATVSEELEGKEPANKTTNLHMMIITIPPDVPLPESSPPPLVQTNEQYIFAYDSNTSRATITEFSEQLSQAGAHIVLADHKPMLMPMNTTNAHHDSPSTPVLFTETTAMDNEVGEVPEFSLPSEDNRGIYTRHTNPFNPVQVKEILKLVTVGEDLMEEQRERVRGFIAQHADTFALTVKEVFPVDFKSFKLTFPTDDNGMAGDYFDEKLERGSECSKDLEACAEAKREKAQKVLARLSAVMRSRSATE
ncbi:hypothetical protein EV424DRAFT_1353660 [Suillus variegatus]|nr:hypothetical protein EV424DRAFT_1353660 [Suillus variegatus]